MTTDTPETTGPPDPSAAPPLRGISRLLLVSTGSVAAADNPFWLTWLRQSYPQLQLRVVLTPTATRFVSVAALHARLGTPVEIDRWPADSGVSRHLDWATWPDAIVVHPATLDYLTRFAAGLATTPSLLAAQLTTAPVTVAPALPVGGVESWAYRQALRLLADRDNVILAAPQRGHSLMTEQAYDGVAALLPDVLAMADHRVQQRGAE